MNIKIHGFSFQVLLPGFLTLAVLGYYLYLIMLVEVNYKPVWSDEFFYYVNALSFYENNSLHAALTNSGNGSLLFNADTHGFAYPLINGLIAKITGWHEVNVVYTNFFFLCCAIGMIWMQKIFNIQQKWFITLFFLLFPFFPLYAFTYMQEVIHILFAVSIGLLLQRISHMEKREKIVFLYIAVVVMAGLFRAVWFFALTGLIPFIKGRYRILISILILLVMIIAALVTTFLLIEPVNTFFYELVDMVLNAELFNAIILLFIHFKNNAIHYFFSIDEPIVYWVMKYTLAAALGFLVYKVGKHKSKIFMAVSLIGITDFLFLFFLYDVNSWRDIRLLSPFIYLIAPLLILEFNTRKNIVLLTFLFLLFIVSIPETEIRITERNGYTINTINAKKADYNGLRDISSNRISILINEPPADHTLDLLSLPLQNNEGKQIYYIVSYYKAKNIKYDFVLAKPGTVLHLNKIMASSGFVLYEK